MPSDPTEKRSDQLWLIPSEGRAGRHAVADVAVALRRHDLYSYAVPAALQERVRAGVGVRVPFGRRGRLVDGLCVRVDQRKWDQTREPIADVLPGEPLLDAGLLELGLWISEYYGCPPGVTFDAMVPTVVRRPGLRLVRYVRATGQARPGRLSGKQRALLDALGDGEVRRDVLVGELGASASSLRTLRKRGSIEQFNRHEPVTPILASGAAPPETEGAAPPAAEDEFVLTGAQREALTAICGTMHDAFDFAVFVLFGVPGSGKTEVYVRAIRAAQQAGRQAILLVPEIALVTQVVDRLARRFARVAVLHSRLPARERAASLHAIAAGAVDLVIGTRTAVYAPCRRLGLIVVDEEQETSLKSLSSPYVHARDIAIKRGQIERIPVVLGSATPSLETWHNAATLGHYRLLRLPERIPGAQTPHVRLVGESGAEAEGRSGILSRELREALQQTLDARQQAILLHNRRGYATALRCRRCGLVVSCTRCGTHMVHHREADVIKCHRCGRRDRVPAHCLDDTCRGALEHAGPAIQRLEEELRRVFPTARLQRADSDVLKRPEDYREALRRFAEREADILLGTQMVAKGLDFPGVQLVGVVDADASLRLPDFRAAEHTFQLLVQVVGRAGRKEAGARALVQCSGPPPPVVRDAIRMDYEAFAAAELEVRRQMFLPPYCRLIRFVFADSRPGRACEEASRIQGELQRAAGRIHSGICVDEAEACVMGRLRGLTRYQVVVRAPRDGSAQRLIRAAVDEKLLLPRVERFTLDVDAIDTM